MLTGRWAACHRQDAGDRSGFCFSSALTSECAQPPRPRLSRQSILWPPSAIEHGDLSVEVLSDEFRWSHAFRRHRCSVDLLAIAHLIRLAFEGRHWWSLAGEVRFGRQPQAS